ncbi:unnamed protein product, partial [Adineta ricciae]
MSNSRSGDDTSTSESSKTTDVTKHHTLVEVELRRKSLYEDLVKSVKNWIFDRSDGRRRLSEMQMSHLVLRYIFNKKATISSSKCDPVFISGTSTVARSQLECDLKNINIRGAKELADLIDAELTSATRKIRFEKFEKDEQVKLSTSTENELIYRDRRQTDFNRLAQRHGRE